MKLQNLFLFVSALAFLPSAIFSQSAEPMAHGVRNDLPRPYETQRDWGTLPAGTEAWAAVAGVEHSHKELATNSPVLPRQAGWQR